MLRRATVLLPLTLLACAAGCSGTPEPVAAPPAPTVAPTAAAEAPAPMLEVPPIWQTPAEVAAACKTHLDGARRLREELVAGAKEPGLERTLVPMNGILIELDRILALSELVSAVHPQKPTREAGEVCQQDAQKFLSELKLDRQVYDALAAVQLDGLAPADRRFVERQLRDYRRAGVDRDDATRKKLAGLQEQMVKLGQDFRRAIKEDKRSIKVTAKELAGLPQDYVDKHPPGEDGKIEITTDYTDLLPLLKYAEKEKVRQALWTEFVNRAYPKNEETLKKLLGLRHEYATILGYQSWAAYNAGDKMLDSEKKVAEFIDRVAAIARPGMEREMKDILARKQKDLRHSRQVRAWDRFHYVIKLQKERYGVDSQEVRAYFDYPQVKRGLLDINQQLFGVTFKKVDGAPVWHPSVDVYDVFEGDQRIARFHLDMHPRDGKYGHAAAFPMYSGVAGIQLPSATLVCNFPEPSDKGPALMEHGDVVTFFHEFGHLMHHLLSGGHKWVTFSGFNTEWDFVETPSQLMEEWAWAPKVLQGFAKHYQTGKPIAEELARKMRAADEFGKGVHVMRQMYLAALSLQYHNQDPSKLDLLDVVKAMHAKYSPYPYEKGTHFFANFGHLEGYTSTYYTYMWSLVLVKDVFTKFKKAGMMDGPTALAYRKAVLQAGASADAMKLVENFLGRPYTFDAFQSWLEQE